MRQNENSDDVGMKRRNARARSNVYICMRGAASMRRWNYPNGLNFMVANIRQYDIYM